MLVLYGAVHLALVILLTRVLVLEATEVAELRGSESRRTPWLTGAAKQELGRQQRRKIHAKASRRSGHVIPALIVVLCVRGRIDGRYIRRSSISVGKATD